MNPQDRVIAAIVDRFNARFPSVAKIETQHTRDLSDNLFVPPDLVKFEFKQGDGEEWKKTKTGKRKICSLRSSSALTVNLFAPLRQLSAVHHGMKTTIASIETHPVCFRFESRHATGAGNRPANLDLACPSLVTRGYDALFVESKMVESFRAKVPKLSASYNAIPGLEEGSAWGQIRESVQQSEREGSAEHLDRKQLVTHAAALFKRRHDVGLDDEAPPTALLALFWMPENHAEIEACRETLQLAHALAEATRDEPVRLLVATVDDLVDEWLASGNEHVRAHARRVAERYCGISVPTR